MGRWNRRVPVTGVPPIVELLDRVSFRSPAELGGGARSSADWAGVVFTLAEMVEQPAEPAAVTWNVSLLAFGGTWIEAGTVATAVLLLKSRTVVDTAEVASSVTVPVAEVPRIGARLTGDRLTDETAITASTTGESAGAARASHGPTLRTG